MFIWPFREFRCVLLTLPCTLIRGLEAFLYWGLEQIRVGENSFGLQTLLRRKRQHINRKKPRRFLQRCVFQVCRRCSRNLKRALATRASRFATWSQSALVHGKRRAKRWRFRLFTGEYRCLLFGASLPGQRVCP